MAWRVSDCGMKCQIVAWRVSECGMKCQCGMESVRLWHGVSDCGMECQSVA